MKKVALTFATLLLSSGIAGAAGHGNYLGALANGTWFSGIQATQKVGWQNSPRNNADYYLALANSSWFDQIPTGNGRVTREQPGNYLATLADGSWLRQLKADLAVHSTPLEEGSTHAISPGTGKALGRC